MPVLARLRVFGGSGEVPVTGEEAAVRIGTSAMVWVCTYCLISCWVAMLEIVFVGPDLTEAKSWRPLFGSFKEAYTLRGFWGYVAVLVARCFFFFFGWLGGKEVANF